MMTGREMSKKYGGSSELDESAHIAVLFKTRLKKITLQKFIIQINSHNPLA